MKPAFDVIVVIPVGPNSSVDFVIDTVDSYHHYTTHTYKVIFADDSQQKIGNELKSRLPDCDVVTTKKAMGGWAGLYITLCLAFRHAVEQYRFEAVLKLDTDALIIGETPEAEALSLFSLKPNAGIAGQYPNDYFGTPWNSNWPRQRIINGTRRWKFFRRPFANWQLIRLHNKALQNGYKTGETVLGGAYFVNETCLTRLYKEGFLPNHTLQTLNLGEDHLFSLLAKAYDFTLESLSGNGQPFGCAWKGLPVSPEQLIHDDKKIIHSVRYWEEMKEADIRSFFKKRREENASAPGSVL